MCKRYIKVMVDASPQPLGQAGFLHTPSRVTNSLTLEFEMSFFLLVHEAPQSPTSSMIMWTTKTVCSLK